MEQTEQEFKQDAIEARKHSEKLFWDELRPKLWGALCVTLALVTMAMLATNLAGWALLPLVGAAFAGYEYKVTSTQYAVSGIQTEADVRSSKESMNLWEAQQKVQQQAKETGTAAAASTTMQDHAGHQHADTAVDVESFRKAPIKPLAERKMDAAAEGFERG